MIKIPTKIFAQNGNYQLVSKPILWEDLNLSMYLLNGILSTVFKVYITRLSECFREAVMIQMSYCI